MPSYPGLILRVHCVVPFCSGCLGLYLQAFYKSAQRHIKRCPLSLHLTLRVELGLQWCCCASCSGSVTQALFPVINNTPHHIHTMFTLYHRHALFTLNHIHILCTLPYSHHVYSSHNTNRALGELHASLYHTPATTQTPPCMTAKQPPPFPSLHLAPLSLYCPSPLHIPYPQPLVLTLII